MTSNDDTTFDPIRAAREEAQAANVRPADEHVLGEQPGDVIGRYKLLQRIGEGGMGVVWMAEQSEPVRRKVALKVIKLGMDTREVVARFEAERQALALMEHPNIARVLDGGATDGGRPFFVMELVRGVPITQYCDEAKAGLDERLALFASVCQAIQHAHTKGVVHRDIKPSNVMVTLHDGVPMAKVIDFGIAKATSAELTQKTLFTRYAQMIGTPDYMAPEQAEMSGLDIDTRADVYSLGVLLYVLLTGTTPFNLVEVLERGYSELLRTIREDEPARPSTRVSTLSATATNVAVRRGVTLDRLRSRLRGDLDHIVMKAMAKDRTRRYGTAVAFAEDVQRFLRNEPVTAVAPSSVYRLRKFVARRRKTVLAIGLLGVSLVLGTTGTVLGLLEARRANDDLSQSLVEVDKQRALAVDAAHVAERRAEELERIARFQERRLGLVDVESMGERLRRELLAQIGDEHRDALEPLLGEINLSNVGVKTLQHEVIAPTVAAIDATFGADPLVQARLLMAVGTGQLALGLYQDSLPVNERALALYRDRTPGDRAAVLDATMQVGESLGQSPRFKDGETMLREAVAELDRDFAGTPRRAIGYATLGKLLGHHGYLDEAEQLLRAAHDELVQLLGPEHETTLATLEALQQALMALGRLTEAEPHQRELVRAFRELYGDHHVKTLRAKGGLAHMLWEDGRFEEAESLAREEIAGLGKLVGDDSFMTLSARMRLGHVLCSLERFDEAEAEFEAARQRARPQSGNDRRLARVALGGLAAVAASRGDHERARQLNDEIVRDDEASGNQDLNRAAARVQQATALARQGEIEEALAGLRVARRLAVEAAGEDNMIAIVANQHIGRMLRHKGKPEEAVRTLRTAFADAQRVFGAENDRTVDIQGDLAIALQASNADAEARALFEQVVEIRARRYGPDDRRTLFAQVNVATAFSREHRPDEARALFEQVLAKLEAVLRPGDPTLLMIRMRLIDAKAAQGARDEAKTEGLEVLAAMRRALGDKHPETLNAIDMLMLNDISREDLEGAVAIARDRASIDGIDAARQNRHRAQLALLLLQQGNHAEAEPLLRAWVDAPAEERGQSRRLEQFVHNALAAALGARGAFAEGEVWMAESCRVLPTLDETTQLPAVLGGAKVALARGVAFYDAWEAAEPGRGHAQRAAELRRVMEGLGDGGR
ncbi:MAG: serine/threonine protein kinase [Planctomycetes bacterium]|nr:serine/threonine protein kinase [Planctomycetota bacterium]